MRPEFVKAMDFARTIKKAVPHQRVIFTVHEMKRLGRGAAELLAIAEDLRHHDIQLELLTCSWQLPRAWGTPRGTRLSSSRRRGIEPWSRGWPKRFRACASLMPSRSKLRSGRSLGCCSAGPAAPRRHGPRPDRCAPHLDPGGPTTWPAKPRHRQTDAGGYGRDDCCTTEQPECDGEGDDLRKQVRAVCVNRFVGCGPADAVRGP
ncbi:hypothetical protein ACFWHQ_37300 [Streptomyces sp. NPDC060334]|uniref:hypothetical protein n=1 Tax=Streptomyces sp. NPDC060334 TaxID=3347099 RepID=UPI00365BD76D